MLAAASNWLRSQRDEIDGSQTLRLFGAALAATNSVTFYFWQKQGVWSRLIDARDLTCWPYWQSCRDGSFVSNGGFAWLMAAMGLLGIVAAAAFLARRTALGCGLLLAATLSHVAIYAHDYGLMGNYHYLPFWTTATFLFSPRKTQALAGILSLQYFFAGLLRLNPEWLAGRILPRPQWTSPQAFAFLCFAVAFLELVGPLGLIARGRWARAAAAVGFVAFHVASTIFIGFMFPLVSLLLFAFWPLAWRYSPRLFEWRGWFARGSRAGLIAPLLFSIAQLPPRLVGGDPPLDGHGRIFALNMFDARAECLDLLLLRFKDRTIDASGEAGRRYGSRIRCEPGVYVEELRKNCESLRARSDFVEADLVLLAKRESDPVSTFRPFIRLRDACKAGAAIGLLRSERLVDR